MLARLYSAGRRVVMLLLLCEDVGGVGVGDPLCRHVRVFVREFVRELVRDCDCPRDCGRDGGWGRGCDGGGASGGSGANQLSLGSSSSNLGESALYLDMGRIIEARWGTTTVRVSMRSDAESETERRASRLECLRGLLRAGASDAVPLLLSLPLLPGLVLRVSDEYDPLRRRDGGEGSGFVETESGLFQELKRAGVSGTSEP